MQPPIFTILFPQQCSEGQFTRTVVENGLLLLIQLLIIWRQFDYLNWQLFEECPHFWLQVCYRTVSNPRTDIKTSGSYM